MRTRPAISILLVLLGIVVAHGAEAAGPDQSPAPNEAARGIGVIELAQAGDNRNFFQRLFGIHPEPAAPVGPRPLLPQQPAPAARTAPPKARATAPPEPKVAKTPDAKVVAVVGDSLASHLARGLTQAFDETPELAVVDASSGPSGLVRKDYKDWPADLGAMLDGDDPPDAVVVQIGLNDRQAIGLPAGTADFGTPEWEAAYMQRVRDIAVTAAARNVPLWWVGLVPMESERLSKDMATIDELIRKGLENTGAVYVDAWKPFASDTGGFIASGPDIDGQIRRLRLSDGIHFTSSGRRKLAFYAEQLLREWLVKGTMTGMPLPLDGRVMSLSDPAGDLSRELLTPETVPQPKKGTPLYRLVIEGLPLPHVPGRADGANMPADFGDRSDTAIAPAPGMTPAN
ncbi:hypothetical protein HDIA_4085 [Hartmannibacter diazotrophicus]|uniref:SGNH hydrolase-type esterase domain-containing protein n=1 Tax=Hartmannibacter diazotrophicus TaxID=1482074 RepID=A0A2C9DBJ0_9HYPH|nr:DUF459 domain-containing protein [Hartmannibacter diazotrophicus]SON57626.1 hypothetical protein HDIA_4085 [Hartmannibacter diazotrophicus]